MTTETLSVPGISCDHCQRTIESALGRLPGIRAAAVDVAARTVQVTFDETTIDRNHQRPLSTRVTKSPSPAGLTRPGL